MKRPDKMPGKVLVGFFALTYGWAWLLWTGSIILGGKGTSTGLLLLAAGGFGPSLAAIVLTYLHKGSSTPLEFWSRAFDPRRLTLSVGVVAITLPLLVTAVAGILVSIGGSIPWAVKPSAILGLLGTSLVLGPLSEELGWRGYALDPLQQRYGPGLGSVVLGAVWAVWHLPLFFLAGTLQATMGFGPFGVWAFAITLIANSVVMAMIYNRTQRSILSTIGYHWGYDFSFGLFAWTPFGAIWAAIIGIIALALLVSHKVGTAAPEARSGSPQSLTA